MLVPRPAGRQRGSKPQSVAEWLDRARGLVWRGAAFRRSDQNGANLKSSTLIIAKGTRAGRKRVA